MGMEELFNGMDIEGLMGMLGEAKDDVPEAGALLDILGRLGDEETPEENLDGIMDELNGLLGSLESDYGTMTLTDEEGNNHDYHILDQIVIDNIRYIVSCEEQAMDDEEAEIYIMEVLADDENGNGNLRFVEDEKTYQSIFNMFLERQGGEEEE